MELMDRAFRTEQRIFQAQSRIGATHALTARAEVRLVALSMDAWGQPAPLSSEIQDPPPEPT
jgi:hypothetical protein